MLPFDESIIFRDSSFFTQLHAPSALPSPAEVRMSENICHHDQNHARLIRFPSLGLIVKYGRTITIAEGQCLWAIRRLLFDVVPVPELYGWCRDGNEVFIYMQLVQGLTLEERWQTLSSQGKVKVCEELRMIVGALSHLEQDHTDQFVGK
jgi:tRNA A-37 threonylcarbamoyl transferase component Bud32